MKRLLILLVLLSVLVGGSSALSQRFDIGQCSYEAWYFADLPVLPDGRYPVHVRAASRRIIRRLTE